MATTNHSSSSSSTSSSTLNRNNNILLLQEKAKFYWKRALDIDCNIPNAKILYDLIYDKKNDATKTKTIRKNNVYDTNTTSLNTIQQSSYSQQQQLSSSTTTSAKHTISDIL